MLSVVTPTFNRRDRLERALVSLAQQDLDDPYEIIVVSDGSTDNTNQYLESLDLGVPIIVEVQENRGPAAARNRGVELARGEYVVFVDDDIVADHALLRAHLEFHRSTPNPVVMTGPMLTPTDHPMTPWIRWEQEKLEDQYRLLESGEMAASGRLFYTGNASAPRALLQEVGGFDERYRRAEDMELGLRLADLGVAFAFAAHAKGYHYAERSYSAWCTIAYDYGRNDVVFSSRWAWILELTSRGWYETPALMRAVAIVGAHSVIIEKSFAMFLRPLSRMPGWVGRAALSVTYRIRYLAGMRDELGSRRALRTALSSGQRY